jgi:cell division protein FtsI (penicillin-binding protein 3)
MTEFSLQARRRTLFVAISVVVLALAMLGRLFDLQIVQHERLVARAEEDIRAKITLHPRRGHIFDRNGRPLAVNLKGYVLWIDSDRFDGNEEARILVAERCERQPDAVRALIRAGHIKGLGFFLCSRWIEPDIAQRLQKLMDSDDLQGITLEIEPKRYYPYAQLVAPVLGYLQDTGDLKATEETAYVAHGGVEEAHDADLRGVDGWVSMERDPENFPIPTGSREELLPRDGAQVTLTLDIDIQYLAQQMLIQRIQKEGARRGDIIVLDPTNGAILAMVSYPSYDPNDIVACANNPSCGEYMHINTPIGLHYEPGSTMKIMTMAIALEEHVIRPDSSFECTGEVNVEGVLFHNWNGGSHGHETMGEILLHSCNVGAVTVSKLIPVDAYYRHLQELGFGQKTGVDLAGEDAGFVRTPGGDTPWSPVDKAANAFGQGIDVTPLQLASAVAAVANGGELWRPYIVQAIERDGVITTTLPTLRGRVFHQETAHEVTDMLVAIGEIKGQNGGPLIPGYHVALKTGTANIPIPGGGYEPNRTIASALGYAPAENPRFLILVRVEGNSVIYGESVAVPIVADLARFLLAYMHIPPSN